MTPGRLYIKIFLSFLAVLAVTMVLVAELFHFTEGQRFGDRFRRFANTQINLARNLVEKEAALHMEHGPEMRLLLENLGQAYRARIWLTTPDGFLLNSSHSGPPPQMHSLRWQKRKPEFMPMGPPDFNYALCGDKRECYYFTIPYGGPDGVRPGIIHAYLRPPPTDRHEKIFLVGLLTICGLVAVLVLPVSWIITSRLNELRRAALRIADGDLSHRVRICGKDEVAKVGKALNTMAESLSRMIRAGKELTANVSHELRTPLTRMRIAEEMLREQFGERGAAHLDSIREDIDALDTLIGKLLALSKIDLKETPFSPEPVDLAEMAETIMDRLETIAEHRGLKVTRDLPKSCVIRAEGEPLHTALNAVLENGVNHASEGGHLSLTLKQEDGEVTLTAANTHAPLPEEELTAIFEPFSRAKGTMPGGTGLGLAMARKIIDRHGGSILAQNVTDGVSFIIRLPMGEPEA